MKKIAWLRAHLGPLGKAVAVQGDGNIACHAGISIYPPSASNPILTIVDPELISSQLGFETDPRAHPRKAGADDDNGDECFGVAGDGTIAAGQVG